MNEKTMSKTATLVSLATLSCALWGSAPSCIKLGYEYFQISAGATMNIILFAGIRFTLAGLMVILEVGKGIFSMKAFGGGSLTAHYQRALDFVFGQPEVDSVMIGFTRKAEIDDLISWLNGSMAADYNPDISKKRVHVNQEDCEGCGACKSMCSAGAIFWSPENGLAQVDPDKCLTCGYCIPACPVRAMILY